MTEPRPLSCAQLCDAARALYAARRNHIEHAEKADASRDKRPPEWFAEQRGRLEEIRQIGTLLAFLAAHADSFEAWKAATVKGLTA